MGRWVGETKPRAVERALFLVNMKDNYASGIARVHLSARNSGGGSESTHRVRLILEMPGDMQWWCMLTCSMRITVHGGALLSTAALTNPLLHHVTPLLASMSSDAHSLLDGQHAALLLQCPSWLAVRVCTVCSTRPCTPKGEDITAIRRYTSALGCMADEYYVYMLVDYREYA